MPPKYFAFIDGSQKGPFTLEQLSDIGIHPSTYVWCKGMEDWQRADSVEEIRNLFRKRIDRKKEEVLAPPPQQILPERSQKQEEQAVSGGARRFYFPETEQQQDYSRTPQVSVTLAVVALFLCFPPTGIAAVIYAYKCKKTWDQVAFNSKSDNSEELKKKSHEYERLAKMWLGLTVCLGVILWTLLFSIK